MDSEKAQNVGGVMVGFMGPGKHERIPLSALLLQNFKVRPGKNRFMSSQARNSPSTLFVSIVFQVHCSGDLTLCWELTRVVSIPVCQNFAKVNCRRGGCFPSEAMCTHLEGKVVDKEPTSNRILSFMVDLYILSPRS